MAAGRITSQILINLLEILARWVVFQTGDQDYTGQVIFNFNGGSPNKEAIYLRIRAKT